MALGLTLQQPAAAAARQGPRHSRDWQPEPQILLCWRRLRGSQAWSLASLQLAQNPQIIVSCQTRIQVRVLVTVFVSSLSFTFEVTQQWLARDTDSRIVTLASLTLVAAAAVPVRV